MIGSPAVAFLPTALVTDPARTDRAGRGLSGTIRDAAPYLGIGSSLAGTLLLFIWGGHWLDRRLGTGPVFFLVGAGLGLLGASYHFYRMYKTFTRKDR